jgi:hypothetical protein
MSALDHMDGAACKAAGCLFGLHAAEGVLLLIFGRGPLPLHPLVSGQAPAADVPERGLVGPAAFPGSRDQGRRPTWEQTARGRLDGSSS